MKRGFTLIEILIVVGIIGIVAAIAIPNFLQATVRAKVDGVKTTMGSIAIALEDYKVDDPAAHYPLSLENLTTPIAYISPGHFKDPFNPQGGNIRYYLRSDYRAWALASHGPDGDADTSNYTTSTNTANYYDPQNGLVSEGDIVLTGP